MPQNARLDHNVHSLQATLRHYRMPTLLMGMGILLSIGGFLAILNYNLTTLEKDFTVYAAQETAVLQHNLNSSQRGMELVQRFYHASENVTEAEFRHFVVPLFERGNFVTFWWVPHRPDATHRIRYQQGAEGTQGAAIREVSAHSEIHEALQESLRTRQPATSGTFAWENGNAGGKSYIALVYPDIHTEKLRGFVVGILDLQAVFSQQLHWEEAAEDTRVYLFDLAGTGEKTAMYRSTETGSFFGESEADYAFLTAYSAFLHRAVMELPSRRWEALFVPTNAYVAQATSLLAWLVLLFGLALTGLVSLFLFLLVTRERQVRKLVEIKTHELRQLTADLAVSERKARAIMDNTVDGLITIDERGIVESYNRACEWIFGYAPQEVVGRNVKMLMPEPYRREHDGYLENYHKTGKAKIIGIGREVEGRRKDGEKFPIDLAVSEVHLEDRKIYSGIVRDISERKEQEHQQRELMEKLVASNTELERFAYVASHDLQEPLRMVVNFTELLARKYQGELDETAHRYIEYASSAAHRMRDLVNDLLEYARIGEETENYEAIRTAELLDYVKLNLQESIREANAEILTDSLPEIKGNPVRVARLMQNLIGNAIKYRREGVAPVIHVRGEEQAREWRFCVQDNGIGMKPEYCQQIFLPFKRLHSRDEYKGNGIGLSVCKKIVESMGGTIWAESAPGEGSRFYFTLPKSHQPINQEKAA